MGREVRAEKDAAAFVVVVHPSNPVKHATRADLAGIFLKKTTRWDDGETIRPVDQPAAAGVRRRFSEDVLQRSVAAVRRYWQQRIFSGRDLPPPEIQPEEAVISYVLQHRGAVAYVSSSAPLRDAKVIPLR
jgi:ABC-type phosphate transport system substrate-binding protein